MAADNTAAAHDSKARTAASSGSVAHGFQDADDVLPTYHIEAQTSLVERPLRSLKFGEAFGVLDSYGDIGVQPGPEGLYFQDTRYLSRLEVTVEGQRPLMLSSVMQDDNGALSVDMTTPDIRLDAHDETSIPRETIAIERTKFLFRGACYDRIGLRSFDSKHRRLRIAVTFDADFRDLCAAPTARSAASVASWWPATGRSSSATSASTRSFGPRRCISARSPT
jgi:glycogen debranching enzyme